MAPRWPIGWTLPAWSPWWRVWRTRRRRSSRSTRTKSGRKGVRGGSPFISLPDLAGTFSLLWSGFSQISLKPEKNYNRFNETQSALGLIIKDHCILNFMLQSNPDPTKKIIFRQIQLRNIAMFCLIPSSILADFFLTQYCTENPATPFSRANQEGLSLYFLCFFLSFSISVSILPFGLDM